MVIDDLGPLEQAILEGVVAAETLGIPLDAAALHRLLPGYRTHCRNVTSALADGRPLRRWLSASGPYYVLCDRADSAVGVSAGRRRAAAAWSARSGLVRGMSKLPWVEAVAAVGPFAQGFLPHIEHPVDLVVIAEGGRVDLARRALGAFRRASRIGSDSLRILKVLDADALTVDGSSPLEAYLWATLQPVVSEGAWLAFEDANPWLRTRFPNRYSIQTETPSLVSDRRIDGRLARLRRSAISKGAEELLGAGGRRPGLLSMLEERAGRRLAVGRDLGIEAALAAGSADSYRVRLEDVRSWAFDLETTLEEPVSQEEPPEIESEDSIVPPPLEGEAEEETAQPQVSSEQDAVSSTPRPVSRRARGPERRKRSGRRSSASPEGGPAGRSARGRKSRRR